MKARILRYFLVGIGILLCVVLLVLKKNNSYQKEGQLFDVLEIEQESVECIAIAHFYSLRATENIEEKNNLFDMLNQEVIFEMKYDDKNTSGESECLVYLFLDTGERLKLAIYNDGVVFEKGNINYRYRGEFDISFFENIPEVTNSTKFWKDREDYVDFGS